MSGVVRFGCGRSGLFLSTGGDGEERGGIGDSALMRGPQFWLGATNRHLEPETYFSIARIIDTNTSML